MAGHRTRQDKSNTRDNSNAKTQTTVSSDSAVASEGGAYSIEFLNGGDFGEATFERHVSLLSDRRLSQPAYTQRRAMIVRQIQRDYGNQYVQRLVNRIQTQRAQGVQTKLKVGLAGDKYEREADSVAKQVVGMSRPVQRQGPEEELQMSPIRRQEDEEEVQMKAIQRQDEEEEELQMKHLQRALSLEGNDVAPELEQAIEDARGGGRSLPDEVRAKMEATFNVDFSDVKIHDDANADALCSMLNARAFTVGEDVFFKEGEYSPDSNGGQELIAHELTHVPRSKTVARGYVSLQANLYSQYCVT